MLELAQLRQGGLHDLGLLALPLERNTDLVDALADFLEEPLEVVTSPMRSLPLPGAGLPSTLVAAVSAGAGAVGTVSLEGVMFSAPDKSWPLGSDSVLAVTGFSFEV
jgi:hypothetical protein